MIVTICKNLTFEPQTFGRSIISRHMTFFAGWSVHGELTCLICGSDTDCFHLTHGGKISYFDCHRCWLPRKHKFRQEQNAFQKDTIVTKGPPKHLSDAQIVDILDKLTPDDERPGYFQGYEETHNWTHKCALWELQYMSTLILMHNIDVMHQERNMGESIISTSMGFLGKTKDVSNRLYCHQLLKKTSYELLIGRKPNISYFQIFGCKYYILRKGTR
jgi:hypothetical protein